MNRGAVPVTSLGPGTPLGLPFAWGGGAFPGGAGSVVVDSPGTSYPYCSTGALGVGEQCAVTVTFSPTSIGPYPGALDLEYSDATGPGGSRREPEPRRRMLGSQAAVRRAIALACQ